MFCDLARINFVLFGYVVVALLRGWVPWDVRWMCNPESWRWIATSSSDIFCYKTKIENLMVGGSRARFCDFAHTIFLFLLSLVVIFFVSLGNTRCEEKASLRLRVVLRNAQVFFLFERE